MQSGIMQRMTNGLLMVFTFAVCTASFAQTPEEIVKQRAAQRKETPNGDSANRNPKANAQNESKASALDTANINLSGDVDYEIVGDQIIMKGNERDLNLLESLISVLEESGEQAEIRVVTVDKRDANEIANTIQAPLRQVLFEPNMRSEHEVTVTALSGTIILVSALPRHIEFVVDVIKQVDEVEDKLGKQQKLVFEIKHRKAAEVAEELTGIIAKMREKKGEGGKTEIQIIPNMANNTLMVLLPESERETVQELIDQLDVEPVAGWGEVKLTLFPLVHSKANEMADVINELLSSPQDREAAEELIQRLIISKAMPNGAVIELPPIDLQKPTRIIADQGTNSLIVATVAENIKPMGELVRLMDGVPIGEEVAVKIYPMRFADAETVGEMLKTMFDEGKNLPEDPDGSGADSVPQGEEGKALSYNIGIASDLRTNTLVLSGRPEQLALAETIINELDRPARSLKFPLKLVQLEHTDASRVSEIMTDLFDQRFEAISATNAGSAAIERERVFLTVDIRSNSLIVSASEENFVEIITISSQLDTIPAKLFDQIRLVTCKRVSAANIKEKIVELWQRKADLRAQEELNADLPVVVVDDRSNTLVIASSVEDFDEIQRLVATLETQPLSSDTDLFKLEYADATIIAEMLDKIFEGVTAGAESLQAPAVIPDVRSNAVVVVGTRDMLERAADLMTRLDVKGGPNSAAIQTYALKFGSASKLAPRMQELFDNRNQAGDIEGTPIIVLADEATNSLVCSASRDDQGIVRELLAALDRPSSIAKQFQIFPLKMAKARTISEKLDALFQSQAEGASGRVDVIATDVDVRTNSVIVWASTSELENIGEIIRQLDTSTPIVEMKVKVIQLKHALAEDFAAVLEETLIGQDAGEDDEQAVIINFDQVLADGSTVTRKLLRQDLRIEPDNRTNSLMVMAPSDSMDMLEAMINDFDKIKPIRSELRLFPLINSDAEAMVDRLDELFNADTSDSEASTQLTFGEIEGFDIANVGQDLRFTADPRTNTLIAAGAEIDLRMVESLVYYLDAQQADERVLEVYRTKHRDASTLADAVQNFNQQEQDVLGDVSDEESQRRRADRQVSIEAVGTEEEGSTNILVGTSTQAYQSTMEMISQLDRPEPQVRISVLIAELTISDDFDLGMEIAGQNLPFSEGAVVGPNGVVQGGDFDYVIGTDLGAAGLGLGGFNFTLTGEDFSFLFRALQQQSRLEVLSRPTLVVRNGEEGIINIGNQVPIVEASRLNDTGQTQSTIGREDVGIVLTTTPQISPDGYVTIQLVQEISQIGENVQLTEGVASPIFINREVDTNVTVRDGETVVIGGLIQTRDSEGVSKVPILGDLPLIGPLFQVISKSSTKTELLVVLSVEVLRTDDEMFEMSKEEMKRYSLPDKMVQGKLMESLRILPAESAMGPDDESTNTSPTKRKDSEPSSDRPLMRAPSRPKPRTYGPAISRPRSLKSVRTGVYGPQIVRSDVATIE